jgi:hypothetical protein
MSSDDLQNGYGEWSKLVGKMKSTMTPVLGIHNVHGKMMPVEKY